MRLNDRALSMENDETLQRNIEREKAIDELESMIERSLTEQELTLFKMAWNFGAEWGMGETVKALKNL